MKKLALPALILLLAFMVYQEMTRRSTPEVMSATRSVPRISKPATNVIAQPTTPRPPITSFLPSKMGNTVEAVKSNDGGRPKPPKNAVPFERQGDLVVAFGDVLLGKPTTPEFPSRGFIEAAPLNRWPNGEIGFSFQPGFRNPERVLRVLAYFNENTPVRFVPFKNQADSIVFAPSPVPLCLSYVGKVTGHQPIYLDDGCGDREITHEVMHALGFIHEQSRPDRDAFLKINWDKIEEDKQSQFEVAPPSLAEPSKGRPFDFQSVMIYSPADFAKNRGEMTMESRTGNLIEPVSRGISPEDLQRLILLYGR